jgi:SAM-dependent methyltransferase
MPEEPLSRRSLLRLDFGPFARPDPAAVKAEIAARWEVGAEALHRAWEPLAPVVCDAAELAAGVRVLDAGTGDGNVALEAARRSAEVTAVDLVPAQLGRAMRREGGSAVRWTAADVEELPYDDASFDVVLSAFGATFAPRPRRTLRELLRVLEPGGLLVLAAPGPYSLIAAVLALAQDSPAALPRGVPSPANWGRDETVLERVDAVAPGTDVDLRTHELALEFESEADAWDAFAGPFGLEVEARDRFADLVAARSASLARVEIEEPVTLVIARRG